LKRSGACCSEGRKRVVRGLGFFFWNGVTTTTEDEEEEAEEEPKLLFVFMGVITEFDALSCRQ